MRIPTGAAVLVLCGLSACSQIDRTRQCKALLAKVNPALDRLKPLVAKASQDSPEQLRAIAAGYDALAKSLERDVPSDPKLKQATEELRGIFTDTARSARALVDALPPTPNRLGAAEQHRRLDALASRERVTAARIDGICRGR